jgi:hypothetical protein
LRGLTLWLAFLALVAGYVGSILVAKRAHAASRFGDSTWVAPGPPFDFEPTVDGPRVAARDRERGWETALRAPFRAAFFPVRLVGIGLEGVADYVGPRYFEPKAKQPPPEGPVLTPYVSLGAVNDIGVGPAVTWLGVPTSGSRFRVAGSWSAIGHRRVHASETFGVGRPLGIRLRGDFDDKPNHRYYGIGNGAPSADLSYFQLSSTTAEAALLLGARPLRQVRIAGGFSGMRPEGGSHGTPLLEDVYAPGSVPYQGLATQELWYGIAADLAFLDDGREPSSGVHGRADFRRASGLHSGDPDYDQWRLEGRAYLPVFSNRRVLAWRYVYAGIEPRGVATTSLPFYRLATSEGALRFAGYSSEHFRDRQLMLARVEYRWAILYRLDALALYELGAVAARTDAFSIRDTHRSYGGGLRLGMSELAALRLEFAQGADGLHTVVALGSDF